MAEFKYRVVDVKCDVSTGRYLLDDVLRNQHGWELVSVVPLVKPDQPGAFYQRAAQAVFKKPA